MSTRVVLGVLWRGDELLMVQQGHQGRRAWMLPGGVVEPGETGRVALRRELREETGLVVRGELELVYSCRVQHPTELTEIVACAVTAWEGNLLPADPDGLVLAAEFLPRLRAIAETRALPWRRARDPLLHHLEHPLDRNTEWAFAVDPAGHEIGGRHNA